MAATFLFSVIIARHLPPAAAGLFFVSLAVFAGAATVGRFGTDVIALKLVASGEAGLPHRLRRLYFALLGASVVAAIPLYWILQHLLFAWLPGTSSAGLALLTAASIVPAAAAVTSGAVLRASGSTALGTLAELGTTPALASLAVLAYSTIAEVQLTHALIAFSLANVLTAGWSTWCAWRPYHRTAAEAPEKTIAAEIRALAPSLSAVMGTALLFYLATWAPVIVLGVFSDSAQAAYYNVAARLAIFVSLAPSIQITYLTPRFAAYHKHSQIKDLNALVRASTRRAVAIGGLATLLLVAFPSRMLATFGSAYVAATPTLRILAIGALVVVALGPVNGLMLTCGQERNALRISVCTSASGLILMVGAAQHFGATGMAAAAMTTAIIYAALASHSLRRSRAIMSHVMGWRAAASGSNSGGERTRPLAGHER